MEINSPRDYERVMARIASLSDSTDPRDRAVLAELRSTAQEWLAGRGGKVAGNDPKPSRSHRQHNPITAMFDRLNEAEKKK